MKNMFARFYSILGELPQNAGRAGATRVDVTFGQPVIHLDTRS